MAEKKSKIVGTIKIGNEPFFEVIDKDSNHLQIRFVYEDGAGLHLPKKVVRPLIQILKAYQEQRRHARWPFVEEVLLETPDKRVTILGRTRDLSESGTSVDTAVTLPRNAEVLLYLPPKKTAVRALCQVRNTREGGLGLEFVTVAAASRSRLARMLQKAREHSVA